MKKEEFQKAWDEALGTETWVLMPPEGICWTEHKLSFVDAIIRACDQIFIHSKEKMARELHVGPTIFDIIYSLPGFRPDPQTNRKPYLDLPKSPLAGTLNGGWYVYKDFDNLTKNSALLIGKGGSYRIEVVRHVVC